MPRRAKSRSEIAPAPAAADTQLPLALPGTDQNPKPKIQTHPDWCYEQAALAAGYQRIARADEVGRGAWAGPLVAAAVVFPPALVAAAGPEADPADPGSGPP